ncbi:pyocin knob domain-containing protein [Lactococcus lactis]|uniref:pyocin knob domain-containing protein n=1 Tax=Lactococcus lactis TaxID=1358 RepID=UPI0032191910
MSYEKQTWNQYDDLKTEEENIENGAVVTDNRMSHIEEGIYSHTIDISNPHKVTAAQVGLGNIQNFGLATEDEAKQAISNAKYMTPSLTQAVLSANINSIAYANSADGTDGFTTVYPNLNLLDGTKKYTKNNPFIASSSTTDGAIQVQDVFVNNLKAGTYTMSAKSDAPWTNHDASDKKGKVGLWLISTTTWEWINLGNTVPKTIKVTKDGHYFVRVNTYSNGTDIETHKFWDFKLELGSTATPYMPSASEVTTADWPKYVGFSNTVKTNKSASDYTWFPVKDSELTNKVESHINNKANPHAVTASQVGAYTKTESDSKLTDLSNKVIANKGNLASGTDLDNVINIGTYRIGGLTGETDIINVPSERSGTTIYAYLTVSGTTTSVVQELIVYDSKTVSQIYSRSRSGSTPTFSPWSKTVVADDSGKVTVTRLETTSDVRTWVSLILSNAGTAVLRYKTINGVVYLCGEGNWGSFTAGQSKTICILPPELRPDVTCNYVITTQNGSGQPMELQVQTGGNVNLWSGLASGGRYGGFVGNYPLP